MKRITVLIFATFVYTGIFAQNTVIHYPIQAFSKEDSTIMRLMNNTADLNAFRDSLKRIDLEDRYSFKEENQDFSIQLNQRKEEWLISDIDTLEVIIHPPLVFEPDPNKPSEPLPDLPIDRTKAVGSIPYQTDIVNGSVTYTVPIQIPESPKGFQPDVALHYSSMSGNDVAGYGWNVSGPSIITYTAGNYFYDGESASTETNASTGCLMLDGMRLIESIRDSKRVIYETETGNIKVYSYIPSKKYYFEVYYPDGSIGIYGNENDNSPFLEYPLFKMTDRFSNYIEYKYTISGSLYRISTIKYGSNVNQLGQIKFEYENREDKHTIYKAGWQASLDKILKSIKVYYGTSTLLYTYTLEHTYKDVNLLSKISCKGGTTTLNPLVFNYGENRTDIGKLQEWARASLGYNYDDRNPVMSRFKMNAKDNKEQLIVYPEDDKSRYGRTNGNNKGNEYGSTYSATLNLLVHTDIYGGSNATKMIPAGDGFQTLEGVDIYGKGNDDLVKLNYLVGNGVSRLIITTFSSSFSESQRTVTLPGTIKEDKYISPYPRIFVLGDFNGDGRTQVLALSSNISPRNEKLSTNSAAAIFNLSTGTQHAETEISGFNMFEDMAFAADITGNGKSELCVVNSTGLHVYSLIERKFQKITSYSALTISKLEKRKFLLGDINKDGKTDLLISPLRDQYSTEKVHEGTCTQACRYSSKIDVTPGGLEVYYYQGKYCYVYSEPRKVYRADAFKWEYLFFTGERFSSKTANFAVPYDQNYNYLLQDVNGDKFPDLVTNENGRISVILNNNGLLEGNKESTTIPINKNAYLFSGDRSLNNKFATGEFLAIKGGVVTSITFSRKEEMERLLTSFYDSYGVKTQYKYNSFADVGTANYSSTYKDLFVIFRAGFPVVSSVTTSTNYPKNETIRSEKYGYYGPVLHKQTRAFMGFGKITMYDNIRKQEATSTYAPDEWGALKYYTTPAVEMSFRYDVSVTKRRYVRMIYKHVDDILTGHSTTSKYDYDLYGNQIKEYTETYHYMKTEKELKDYPGFNNYNSSVWNKFEHGNKSNLENKYNEFKEDTVRILAMQASGTSIITDRKNESGLQTLMRPMEPLDPINPDPIGPLIPLYPNEIDLSFTTKQTITRTFQNVISTSTGVYQLGILTSQTITREDQSENSVTVADTYTLNSSYLPATHKQTYEGKQTLLEEFVYDATGLGNLIRHSVRNYQAANPLVTQYEYDIFGRIIRTIQPMENLYTLAAYNTKGWLSKVTDHKGLATSYTYDNWGNATSITYPGGVSEKRTYSWSKKSDEGIWTLTRTMTNQPTTRSCYDQLEREIKSAVVRFDGVEMVTDKKYNQKGLLNRESLPYREGGKCKWNYILYDEWNRVTQKQYATGNVERYYYDMAAVVIRKDRVYTKTLYDAQGNAFRVEDPAGTISYKYRPDGQIYQILNDSSTVRNTLGSMYQEKGAPGEISTTIEFDEMGRKVALNDPSTGKTIYTYDASGNMCEEKLASGKTIRYSYDKYNRLIEKDAEGVLKTTYTYTEDNLPETEKSENQTITYGYDSQGRLISHTDHIMGEKWLKKEMTYLTGDMPASVTYTSQDGVIATENYTYKNGYLTEVKLNNTTSVWKLIEEDENGRPIVAETGPLQRTYTYDTNGLPSGRIVRNGNRTIQNFAYSFIRTTGNLDWRSDKQHNKKESFTYDRMNRLVSFDSRTITYDNTGNILQFDGIGNYEYPYKSYPYQTGILTLEEEDAIPYQTQEITYNAMRQPNTIAEYNFYATFAYGNAHQRVKMVIAHNNNSWLTRYYLGNYEADESEKGTTERLYISGDAYSAPAVYIKENGVWDIHYICRDYLGSITHITDKEGNLRQELSYDAWGQLRDPETHELYSREEQPELLLGRGYTGHEHLSPFGIINMNARLYDPALGRFLSPDPYVQAPYNTQNFNRYSYALNNPLRYTDESGELLRGLFYGLGNLFAHMIRGDVHKVKDAFKYFGQGFAVGMTFDVLGAGSAAVGQTLNFIGSARAGIAAVNMGVGGIKNGWKGMGNAGKIYLGNFYLDENASFAQGIIHGITRHAWEYPQNLVGNYYAQIMDMIGKVSRVDYFGGATFATIENSSKTDGITIGNFITINISEKIEGDFDRFVLDNELYMHEYGHTIDSRRMGIGYLLVVGVPSIISASKSKSLGIEGTNLTTHKVFWTERRANNQAAKYFKKYFGIEWDFINYPLKW